MIFYPAWISSIDHINAFKKAYSEASWPCRLVGAYRLPEGFPYIRGLFGIPFRMPVVMFASGELNVSPSLLGFISKPWRISFEKRYNFKQDLHFELTAEEIVAIDRCEICSPVISSLKLPFMRVRTRKDGLLLDFLISIGGKGIAFGKIRERNEQLFEQLSMAFPNAVKTMLI